MPPGVWISGIDQVYGAGALLDVLALVARENVTSKAGLWNQQSARQMLPQIHMRSREYHFYVMDN